MSRINQGAEPRKGFGRGRGIYYKQVHSPVGGEIRKQEQEQKTVANFEPSTVQAKTSLLTPYDNSHYLAWVRMLEHAWNLWKKNPNFVEKLHQYFETVPNVYLGALYMMTKVNDFRYGKAQSLAFAVMEEFSKWIKSKGGYYKDLLTPELKECAFTEVCKQRNTALIKLVCDIFECAIDKEMFLQSIKTMLLNKDYKEACLCASFLNLHSKFSVEDFVIPLLFQDKNVIAEVFLQNSPDHQKELLKYLDNLIGNYSIKNEVESIIVRLGIPHCKTDNLYYKPLSKLIVRLLQMFNLKMDLCPNLLRKKRKGVLSFLINKRFDSNQNSSSDSWREMVLEAVGSDPEMQLELVQMLDFHMDYDEALFWVQKFNVPFASLPYNVREFFKNPEQNCTSDNERSKNSIMSPVCHKEDTSKYHKLKIPLNHIHMIDSAESFSKVLEYGFKNINVVGIDTEWKPVFCSKSQSIALLQVATETDIYIFDIITLQTLSNVDCYWNQLGTCVFGNVNITKLGFGLSTDLHAMKCLPLGDIKLFGMGYLDLVPLWRRLVNEFSFIFPFPGEECSSHESLSKLVSLTLGKILCKLDQFSNWEKRPLRQAQLEYAALDAYCLIEIYKVLEVCCKEQNIPLSSVCYEIMSSTFQKKGPKKKRTSSKDKIKEMLPSPIKEPISVHDIKFVVDTMLQGLGHQLRNCGIDTAILNNHEPHAECLNYAAREKRMILTRGHVFDKLYKSVAVGHCLRIESELVEEQLEEVTNYYKINITEEDIFSRCQCNYDEFTIYTSADVTRILNTPAELEYRSYCRRYEDDDEDDDFDDDYGFSDHESSCDEFLPGPSTYTPSSYTKELSVVDDLLKMEATKIPAGVLDSVNKFYSCNSCKKFYWDGSHLKHILQKFSKVTKSKET